MGIDAILLVEGRELLHLKLLDAVAHVSKAAPYGRPLPGDLALTVAVTVGDAGLRDMQVRSACLAVR